MPVIVPLEFKVNPKGIEPATGRRTDHVIPGTYRLEIVEADANNKSKSGKKMPIDWQKNPDLGSDEDEIFDPQRMVSHFDTCPNAASHRKRNAKKKEMDEQIASQRERENRDQGLLF